MKLLQRSARHQLVLAVPLLLLGTAIGYSVVNAVVTEEVDEQLQLETTRVVARLNAGERSFSTSANDQMILVTPGAGHNEIPKDSIIYEEPEHEEMPWRISRSSVTLTDGSTYMITVGRSMVETEDLVMAIAASMAALLVLLIAGNWLLNRWSTERLWRPFRNTMSELQRFHLDGSDEPRLPDTNVEEFTAMNRTLRGMTAKLRRDFMAQKRFTEHVAHELRTPLAIMQGRLDQLIQSPNMAEGDAEVIDGLLQARERMGRIVANMLLLARIGNQQFPAETVDWPALFQEQHHALEDLIAQRGQCLMIREEAACDLRLHPLLAEVLVTNLLRNAVQHGSEGSSVDVAIRRDGFTITNAGAAPSVDPTLLFERFIKGDHAGPGTGLGLSMAKEIADQNGLELGYVHADGTHKVTVTRRPM